jgi:fructose-1,6-bisphosphatase I
MNSMVTIDRHILEEEKSVPGATGAFSDLIYSIALAGKIINREVSRAGLINLLGKTGGVNVQGETVAKLDDYANDVLVNTLSQGGRVCVIGSEECAEVIHPPNVGKDAKYVVHFDPLDGSSNIDANVSIGTIFSISERVTPLNTTPTEEDVLQPGTRMIGAGYIVYGSSTIMVYTTKKGTVNGFTLDPSVGEFLRSHQNIRTPTRGKILSCNVGHSQYWEPAVDRFIRNVTRDDKDAGLPYTLRYIGSLVADVHRNLLYGGIFLYPPNVRGSLHRGKLRLLYEANPLAMVVENAGGLASTGSGRVLDLKPTALHQRTPLYIGSRDDVLDIERMLREQGETESA